MTIEGNGPKEVQRSGAGQKGDEKERQMQVTDMRGDTRNADVLNPTAADDEYHEEDWQAGGAGKQGDQQQLGKERPQQKDKSRDEGGSDKQHGP